MRLHEITTRVVGAALVGGLLSACAGTGSGFAPTGVSPNELRTPSRIDSFTDMGRATASTQVNLAVVLRYRNQDELDKLVEDQADPGSGQYHHFLSQGQFVQRFGPTRDQYESTIKQLQDAGFTVAHTFTNRTVIDVSGPAPAAEKLFSTQIDNVQLPDGRARYTERISPTIPAQLGKTVIAVVGLDSAHPMHPMYEFAPNRSNPIQQRVSPAKKKKLILFGPDNGYGPQVWRIAYNFPKALGQGQATGVVGDADFLDTDLAGFLSYFGEKQKLKTIRVAVDGGAPPNQISPDTVETNLDTQTVIGINPDAQLYMYTVPPESSNINNFTDMYNQAVQDDKVDTVNTSYSQCETAFDPNFPTAADQIFEQGGSEGMTFHASSGDYGVYTFGCSNTVSVGAPTDTPHGVSIGGTALQIDHTTGKETSEVGWDDTGGGVSTVFKLPSYQKGVKNIIKSGRNLPDLAFDASPYTGASLYYDGSFQGPIGGTSLASPIFGAGLTAVDQTNKSKAGYLNPTLYTEWGKVGYGKGAKAYFRDITTGSIGIYSAKTGYDQMSGIGVMLFDTFGPYLK